MESTTTRDGVEGDCSSSDSLATLSSCGHVSSALTCCRSVSADLRTGCTGSALDRVDVTCTYAQSELTYLFSLCCFVILPDLHELLEGVQSHQGLSVLPQHGYSHKHAIVSCEGTRPHPLQTDRDSLSSLPPGWCKG